MSTTKRVCAAPRSTSRRRSALPTSPSAQVEQPAPLAQRQDHGLAVRLWKRDDNDEMELELHFRTIAGERGRLTVTRDLRRTPKPVFSLLEARGAVLKAERPQEALADLLMTENLRVHRLTATPGWHHATFVPARHSARARDASGRAIFVRAAEIMPAYVDHVAGTSQGWRRCVGAPARQSTAMSFAILVALAAPLAAHAGLPEGCVFNLFQDSSVGKTTVVRAAASVAGDPDQIGNWNTTERGLEEYVATHNGYAVIFDDTEKSSGDLTKLMRAMTHIVTGGQSRIYSSTVQAQLRPLSWFCFGLSTSPASMSALASSARAERSAGERVRLIDLPVPDQTAGGVFDRLAPGPGTIGDRARAAIDAIEGGIKVHHGQLFRDWCEVFKTLTPEAIMARVAAVEAEVTARDNLDGRLRRKFAIVRAAGVLAVEHEILDWPVAFVGAVVDAMLDAARGELQGRAEGQQSGWCALRAALTDPDQIAPIAPDGRLSRPFAGLLGVRTERWGVAVVALDGTRLRALFGGRIDACLAPVRARNGLVREGRRDTDTLQFVIKVPGADKPLRPRLYAVRADVLSQVLAERVRVGEEKPDQARN